jgi:hypothetical protein
MFAGNRVDRENATTNKAEPIEPRSNVASNRRMGPPFTSGYASTNLASAA